MGDEFAVGDRVALIPGIWEDRGIELLMPRVGHVVETRDVAPHMVQYVNHRQQIRVGDHAGWISGAYYQKVTDAP